MSRNRPRVFDPQSGERHLAASRLMEHEAVVRRRTATTHSYAAVAFYTNGAARVEQQGEWKLQAGDLLIVPAGVPHRVSDATRSEFWGLSLWMPRCFLGEDAQALLEPFERVREGAAAVVHIPPGRQDYLAGLLGELADVGEPARGLSDTLLSVQRSLVTLILAEIDVAARANLPAATSKPGVVVDALRFIERHCLRPLMLNDVAEAVGRSPAYVTTALAQATGRSAVEWIVSGRMAEARRLLLHTDELVDAIARRVGYADSTHFIRMFRRHHRATPAAWRLANTRGQRGG